MITFTTRQREILKIILDVNRPIGSVELAKLLHITPRQVNYSMKGVKVWLKQHGQDLNVLPGVGFTVNLTADQTQALVQKINIHSHVHIVLSVSQRQQLLALFLLTRTEPVILALLEQISHVSRMTILKDLDEIENWLQGEKINLIRKPHFGIQVSGADRDCQQALAELLWGETPFSHDPVTEITHSEQYRVTARFPKVILGKTLGEGTELSCEVRANGDGGIAIVDAFPLDAVERKLMFGARPGVTLTVVTWFIAHLEHNLGLPPAQ